MFLTFVCIKYGTAHRHKGREPSQEYQRRQGNKSATLNAFSETADREPLAEQKGAPKGTLGGSFYCWTTL